MHAHLFCDSKNYVHMCKNQPRRESPEWGTMANFVIYHPFFLNKQGKKVITMLMWDPESKTDLNIFL